MPEPNQRLSFARNLAFEVGELLQDGQGKASEVRTKASTTDLLTEYDLKAEELILARIREAYPEEGILSEEAGAEGPQESVWIVDPLDGTTNFAHGLPIFSVSIAHVQEDRPTVAVVHAPLLGETFTATAGAGSALNDKPLRVSTTSELQQSLLVTGFPYNVQTRPDNNLDNYAKFSLRTRAVRRLGSAAVDLCYVGAGRFDGYWEVETSPWDFAAGMLVIQEAGGKVTRVDGSPPPFTERSSILATNGLLHRPMQELLEARSD